MVPGRDAQTTAILNANKILAEIGTRATDTPESRTFPPGARLTWLAWLGIGAAIIVLFALLWTVFFPG